MSETELAEQGEVVRGSCWTSSTPSASTARSRPRRPRTARWSWPSTGDDLGLLIGPKGQTLQAIQELSRSALQRQKPGETHARIRVDVARLPRAAPGGPGRFTREVAEQVKATGVQKALEPMCPPDRKVVHDTVNDIDGVTTVSEGEDARRRVVILPA